MVLSFYTNFKNNKSQLRDCTCIQYIHVLINIIIFTYIRRWFLYMLNQIYAIVNINMINIWTSIYFTRKYLLNQIDAIVNINIINIWTSIYFTRKCRLIVHLKSFRFVVICCYLQLLNKKSSINWFFFSKKINSHSLYFQQGTYICSLQWMFYK